MRPQYVDKLWNLMSEKSEDVDLFLPVSHYFGKLMQGKMMLPEEKIHPVHIGIDLSAYAFKLNKNNPPVLGYLSRLNEENGLEIIIDAFIILKSKFNHSELKLKLTGGETGDDKSFIRKQKKKLKKAGLLQEIEILDAYEGQDKIDFLQSLTLLSVPVLKGEAFGLYQLESIACGTPIVQPALGAFPEIIDETQGGLYYSPNSPEALAQKLDLLLRDPDKLEELAIKGRKNLEDKFNMKQQVDKMITAYTKAQDEKKKKV
jgi:glycosyltransferase involved in cell wall biosynthesis